MHIKTVLLVIFTSFCFILTAQNNKTDSLHWDNGELTVELINYKEKTIFIQHFDSLGRINEELNYQLVDSVECFQCDAGKKYIHSTYGYFSDSTIKTVLKVGDWKYYNEGKLDRVITYLPLAYQYEYANCNYQYEDSKKSLPCEREISVDFLIKNIKYFDERGNVLRVDSFKNGIINSTKDYKAKR